MHIFIKNIQADVLCATTRPGTKIKSTTMYTINKEIPSIIPKK